MNTKLVFLLVAIAFVATVSNSPVESDSEGELIRADRHRRVTCDLLSLEVKKFKLNDVACAAHCLGMLKEVGASQGDCLSKSMEQTNQLINTSSSTIEGETDGYKYHPLVVCIV
ncbi:hypothetical protein RN001_000663 [Aquatica leii]|uniref:Uncharacterized protein n=1 Tax=Aquatica leii TaxID=1421715 RepID=A0AAN7Q7B5_9COLE|nr:hypothetical protein RN001_000663 [Aquatica leii]